MKRARAKNRSPLKVFSPLGRTAELGIGRENIFPAEEDATMATKKTLKRAQQLIGAERSNFKEEPSD